MKKMMSNRPLILALALGAGLAAGSAQAGKTEKKEEPQPRSFGLQALAERFEATSPKLGERVPNVPVYTASGEKVRFRNLVRDHYSVVVLGCLT